MKKLLLATTLVSFAAMASAADLNICVEGAYPPFSETNENGEIVGFDIDMTNALCEEMGKECELVKVDWDGIIPALIEGKCDAIIASMSNTEERRQVIAFSDKYYNTPNYFVGKEGATMEDLLAGKIGVQRGTIHHDFMEKVHPDTELVLYGTQDEAFLDLKAGRIDGTTGDGLQLLGGFVNTDEGAGYAVIGEDVTDPEIHGSGASVAVRQGEEALADEFSAAIAALRESGKYKEINDKYFEIDIYGAE